MIKIEIYSTNLLVTIYATCQLDYTDLEEVKVFKKKKKKKKSLKYKEPINSILGVKKAKFARK